MTSRGRPWCGPGICNAAHGCARLPWRPHRSGEYKWLVDNVRLLRDDTSLSGDEIRPRLDEFLEPFTQRPAGNRAAVARRELASMSGELRPFLRAITSLPLVADETSPLARALPQLRALYRQSGGRLPEGLEFDFPRVWQPLLDVPVRGLEAASLSALERGLKNGTVSLNGSLSYQDDAELFILDAICKKERPQHLRRLSLPRGAGPYLQKLRALPGSGLEQLDEAVRTGTVRIEDGSIRAGNIEAEARPQGLRAFRRRLFSSIGAAQFPEPLLEVDEATRFSWALLGRPPRRERELIAVYAAYAALIAHGSHLTPAEVVRMVPGLTPDIVAPLMARLEMDDTLRDANDAVLTFMRQHAITRLWGDGVSASADMMSLETSRRLWLSRVDPRRRTYAVGTYTHVLDQFRAHQHEGSVHLRDGPVPVESSGAGCLRVRRC